MILNLFVTFPAAGTPGFTDQYLLMAFAATGPWLEIHWLNGIVIFALAITGLSFSFRGTSRRTRAAALLGFLSVSIAGLSGLLFIASGFANNGYSYIMAIAFVSTFVVYFDLLYSSNQAIR